MRSIISNISVLPRWVILLLDHFILFWGYIFATLVRFNFELKDADRWLDAKRLGTYLGAYFIISLIFKPHASVVRYTQREDIFSVLKTLAVSGLMLAALNFLVREFFPPRFVIPFSILIVSALMNGALLSGYRYVVKEFFKASLQKVTSKKRAVIFGAGATGRSAAGVMMNETSAYHLVAFFDDDIKLSKTKIYGKPVFHSLQNTVENLEKLDAKVLIIATTKLSKERRNQLVEACLKLDVSIKEVPDPNKWVAGQLSERQFKDVEIQDLLGRDPIQLAPENAVKAFSGKVVLVTGAAGSIGSEICRQLRKCELSQLIMLDQSESALYDLEQEQLTSLGSSFVPLLCDVSSKDSLRRVFEDWKPSVVFHAAAYKHVPLIENQPLEGIHTNVLGTKNLADLSDEFGVEKFILVSTDKAVNPTNVMGATKRAAEIYVQTLNEKSDVQFITTRFGNVLGSNGSVIPLFTKQIQKGGPITITHKDITRFFMTIPEACSLVLEAGAMGKGGQILLFDMGKPVKIYDLAKKMIGLAGLEEGRDIEIKFVGLRSGEKLHEEVLADLEGIQETHHPKIMIAGSREHNLGKIEKIFERFCQDVDEGNEIDAVKTLKQLIPEFKSNKSKFEKLDV